MAEREWLVPAWFLMLAVSMLIGFGWSMRGVFDRWRGRSTTHEAQIRELELRLQSKHNALKIAIAGRDEALERLRASWQARSDEHANTNRNGILCGVQRADGAPCTLEREHVGQPHSYAGATFEQIFDGFACPLCGRT